MAVRKTKTIRADAGGAALLALGAGAVTAQAVTTSTYSVSEIRQASLVRATSDTAAGSFDYRAFTSFRFTGRGTGNRFTVRHSTRAFPAGITRRAQRGERTGRMEFLSNQAPTGTAPSTCAIGTRAIPARERAVSLLVVPPARNTTTRPKKLQINVQGPDALGEISKAVRTGRCRTPILSPRTKLARGGKLPLGFDSFTVAPDKLKREFTGRRSRPVVLSGKRTTILQVANGIPVGTVTVTTSVILRLVRST